MHNKLLIDDDDDSECNSKDNLLKPSSHRPIPLYDLLYRFATLEEKCYMVIGLFGAMVVGIIYFLLDPLMSC
jgi:hypothetical protein